MPYHMKGSYWLSENGRNREYRLFPSVRLFNFCLVFIGSVLITVATSTFNFTLVCMINSTAVAGRTLDDELDNEIYASKMTLPLPQDIALTGKADWALVENQTSLISHKSDSCAALAQSALNEGGDVEWDRQTQSVILAGVPWAMLILTLPGAMLLDRYGAKTIYCLCQILNAASMLLTPWAAYQGTIMSFAVRFLAGIPSGLAWPCIMAVVQRWSPSGQAGIVTAICSSGFPIGSIVASAVGGVFCTLAPGTGWKIAFYFWGILNVVYVFAFWLLYKDAPQDHCFISDRELRYIIAKRKIRSSKLDKEQKIPYKKIVTSPAVIATVTSTFSANWTSWMVGTFLPTYIKEVLFLDTKSNGLLSGLPYITQFIGRMTFGTFSDKLTCLDRTATVKLFDALTLGLPGLMFLTISFMDCSMAYLAIACFAIGHFFYSCSIAGYVRSTYYIAPQYVGAISGIGGTFGALSALLMPYVIGAVTRDATPEQWKVALYISAGVSFAGLLNFALFGSGKLQSWAQNAETRLSCASVSNDIAEATKKQQQFEENVPRYNRQLSVGAP